MFSISICAYSQYLKFEHLTVSQGLSNNTISCFLQDTEGFMWIGTPDGLNRYNGYGFEIYRQEDGGIHSLPDNHINDLYEDSEKRLWIATYHGICRYDRKFDRFIKVKEILNEEVIDDVSVAFLEDTEKKLWVAFGKRLYYLDSKSDKFIASSFVAKANIFSFLQLEKDKFLVATLGEGFYIFDVRTGKTDQFIHQDKIDNSICNNNIWAVYKDIKGYVWIGTEHGLDRFDPQKLTFEHFKIQSDSTKSLLAESIRHIVGRGNDIWFGTENGGLSTLNITTMRFKHHLPDANDAKSINDISIWAMYWDRQDRLWVGTFSGGVNVADPHGEKFPSPKVALKNKTVNTIFQDNKDRLWIGTEGGLVVKDKENVSYYSHQPNKANSLANNPVLAIYQDDKSRIWVSTWGGGLSLFDEKNKGFTNFRADFKDTTKLSNSDIYDIAQSSQTKQILATSWGGGVHILKNERQQTFLNYAHQPNNAYSVSNSVCKRVYEDSKKNIWIGSTNGLNRFDIITKNFFRYYHDAKDSNSLSNSYINCIWEDAKGRIWIGTADGLNQMVNENQFVCYNTKDGLPNNSINGILDDSRGNLWISTNSGIARFNPETKAIRNYDEGDGLQSKQFKSGSYFKAKDGQLFFGGVNGLNVFYPDSIQENPFLPSVLITGLKIFNKTVEIGDYDSLLEQSIEYTKEISFSHKHSVFTLEYVALNFTHSEKNQYAYILEEFEKEWNYVGNKREATYTNLDAGTYTFRVKASNNDGLWNETGIKLIIHIRPPWWETWWFKTLIVLVFVVSGPIFYFLRIKTIKKQNQRLEKTVLERTLELSNANTTLQENAKELLQNQEEIATLNNHLEILVEERTKKLIRSNQKLNEYAFFNAHKLRAPVATILGLYELLKLDLSAEEREIVFEKIQEFITYLDEIVRKSQSLLDDLED